VPGSRAQHPVFIWRAWRLHGGWTARGSGRDGFPLQKQICRQQALLLRDSDAMKCVVIFHLGMGKLKTQKKLHEKKKKKCDMRPEILLHTYNPST
jgi:hypothetical protein